MAEQLALTRPSRSGLTTNPNRAVRQQIPAFLNKLYSMVNDPETNELIRWSDEGDSFFVPNHERFGRELLPRFFKHGNFSSFVRQLNMYGFHKVPHLQQGVLQNETVNELWQFVSPHFQRGQPDLLMLIQRKKANATAAITPSEEVEGALGTSAPVASGSGAGLSADARPSDSRAVDISSIASSLAAIKRHQTAISDELKDLQQSNTALWQEAVAARERHKKHQDTINRILKFLAGVFGNGAGGTGGHGGSVRDHDEESLPRDSSDSGSGVGSSVALVPRKRPRLMIEESSSGNVTPVAGSSKSKRKEPPTTRAQVEEAEDDAWADEHLLVPMDADDLDSMDIKSSTIRKETPSQWRNESAGRIESVASTPASTSVSAPPTPRFPVPTPNGLTSGHSATLSTGNSSNSFPLPFQNASITPAQLYSYNSQSNAPMTDTNPAEIGSSGPIDPTLQALLNSSPGSFQRLMSSMSQPGGLPVMSQAPAMPPQVDFGHPTQYSLFPPNNDFAGSQYPPNNNVAPMVGGQLIPTAPNPFSFLSQPSGVNPMYGGNANGAPASQGIDLSGSGNMSADAVLAMLSGQNGGGYIGNGDAPSEQDLANSLTSYTNNLNRSYTDTSAINAEVDALQQSINSLIESIGLDPATLSQLHEDGDDAGHNAASDAGSANPVDFGAAMNPFPHDDAGGAQADFSMVSSNQVAPGETADHDNNPSDSLHDSGFLDEVGTASTASSPNVDMKDDFTRTKAATPTSRARLLKRKSEVVEPDISVPVNKPRKYNRKK